MMQLRTGLMALLLCAPVGAYAAAHAGGGSMQKPAEGYLGIGFHDVTDDEAASMHLKNVHGAEVVVVDHDGPAGKAGLRPRDIIMALNGKVVDSAATLKRMIHEAGANVQVALDVMRGGQKISVTAKLVSHEDMTRSAQERLMAPLPPPPANDAPEGVVMQGFVAETFTATPDEPDAAAAGKSPKSGTFLSSMLHSGPFTGLGVAEMAPQLRLYFGAASGAGLLVNQVDAGSPAANAGLRAGDVLEKADGVSMHSVADWTRHLKNVKGRAITVVVVRERKEQTMVLSPDLKHRSSANECVPPICADDLVQA